MKKTLLQIVQSILSDMDSEDVNSISDSIEAQQVASVVEDVYFNMIATRMIPEHQELLKPTAASDNNFPTHFMYPVKVKEITNLWYEDKNGDYREIAWCEPMTFLSRTDTVQENYQTVYDKNGGTKLRIRNNQDPTFYTSFDDGWLVLNSFDNTVDDTLQASKVRAYGTFYPTFSKTDDFVPDIDNTMFPYLIVEVKFVVMLFFKGQSDPKIEQAARRQKSYMQNDMYKTKRPNNWSNYGR